jgi:hypothetical protein
MAYKFNPFTDTLDIVGSGGGSSYIDGEVEYHADLPVTVGTPAVNSAFLVRKGQGFYFLTRKPAGIWVRELNNGNLDDWKYAGTFSDLYRDANFRIINDTDTSKELAFSLSGLTTGTTRTITVPDANVTLPNQGTSTGDSPTFAQVTINDTVNEQSTLTLANDTGANIIEFEAQELSLNHTGGNDTPYISVSDGVDEALLGLRQGEMFLQGSNPVVRIEKSGGALADIKVNKLILEDATTAGDFTATFDADGNLSANRTYDLPDASGVLALTSNTTKNLWIPASAWIPKTTAGCGVDSRETTTNDQNFDELLFDTGSDEFADALVVMPSNYNNGTITARFYWTAASSSGTVEWAIQGRAFANDDALDTAAGTKQSVNDTLIAADDMHITSATSACTIGGTPAANTPIQFTIYRDVSEDTLAVDARLLGVEIIFN